MPVRRQQPSAEHPWQDHETQNHAVTSASWDTQYPALDYRINGYSEREVIPDHVIYTTLRETRFAVVVWQPSVVTFIDVSQNPRRTHNLQAGPPDKILDWGTIRYYEQTPSGPAFYKMDEDLDPREVIPSLEVVLRSPIGTQPGYQGVVPPGERVERILIEFTGREKQRDYLHLDTTIAALGGIATHEYLNTVRGWTDI